MFFQVISPESKQRIINIITQSEKEGASILLDGRKVGPTDPKYKNGNFIGATILADVQVIK